MQGFSSAESLAAKVVSVFDCCRSQFSCQKHYDFGLRALKAVLASAGIILRDLKVSDAALSEGDEDHIVREAFKGSILPKLLKDDAALLLEVLARTFKSSSASFDSDSTFIDVLALSCQGLHLCLSPLWTQKVLQIKQLARF